MVRLEANAVCAGYGAADSVRGVSFSVSNGELVGLLGPNGSGKSTLLRTCTGFIRPRAGSIGLDGLPVTDWNPGDRSRVLSFVPQSERTEFDFSVRETVAMGRYPHTRGRALTSADYEVVASCIAEMDCSHLCDRPVTRLSGGEHRRVLVARALAQESPVLVMDEPTAHLDISHQLALLDSVKARTSAGAAALTALHDLNQAAEYCDRIVLLKDGEVAASGSPDDVLREAVLAHVYGCVLRVVPNPLSGRPLVLNSPAASARLQPVNILNLIGSKG